jgi:2-polyprenyl-6-hydroxyphenyl methylase/3-demethylubiquinone-9 3-methyltransferase
MALADRNIDAEEISRFAAMADRWWDRRGEFKALHDINPVRLAYVQRRAGLAGKQVLDVGCGGGLLCEAMAVAGGRVTGIDMAAKALMVAQKHAAMQALDISYRQSSAEAWVLSNPAAYDLITCMELVEHVPDPASLVLACSQLVKPGGHLFFATVNRTWLARILVIWAAENIFGIVRKGTHRFNRFIKPRELAHWGRQAGLVLADMSGVRYIPFIGRAGLSKNACMNYLMHFTKR